jgi:hypothetical protein
MLRGLKTRSPSNGRHARRLQGRGIDWLRFVHIHNTARPPARQGAGPRLRPPPGVVDNYPAEDRPGGPHALADCEQAPRLAWEEGHASWDVFDGPETQDDRRCRRRLRPLILGSGPVRTRAFLYPVLDDKTGRICLRRRGWDRFPTELYTDALHEKARRIRKNQTGAETFPKIRRAT